MQFGSTGNIQNDTGTQSGPRESWILQQTLAAFSPIYFELENESHKHAAQLGGESHFRLLVVSSSFDGVSRIDRSRKVHQVLDQALKEGLHALALRCFSEGEWQALSAEQKSSLASPKCLTFRH
jgi:BolA family transcriptional regulator, general stress-responsive regulator